MDEAMKLEIGWTVVMAFDFTTAATCGSLVGWVRFANRTQQQGLYTALILEVVVFAGTSAAGVARFSPAQVSAELKSEGGAEAIGGLVNEALDATARGEPSVNKEDLERLVELIPVTPGSATERKTEELKAAIGRLPAGQITPDDVRELRRQDVFRLRGATRP
jgi:hypothetical protein